MTKVNFTAYQLTKMEILASHNVPDEIAADGPAAIAEWLDQDSQNWDVASRDIYDELEYSDVDEDDVAMGDAPAGDRNDEARARALTHVIAARCDMFASRKDLAAVQQYCLDITDPDTRVLALTVLGMTVNTIADMAEGRET